MKDDFYTYRETIGRRIKELEAENKMLRVILSEIEEYMGIKDNECPIGKLFKKIKNKGK